MSKASDTFQLKNHTLKNRIAMLPVMCFSFQTNNKGEDYYFDDHIIHYTKIAKGGPGLIIVQGTNVKGIEDNTYNWTPGSRKALTRIAEIIKANDVVAMIQLSWGGDRETDLNAVSTEFLKQKQDNLLKGILAVHEMGYDGVEIHLGHGFLLAKMFDKVQNQRTDCYGGPLENRSRVITEVIAEARKTVGEDFIISARIGAFLPDLETGIETAKYLEANGVDMFDVTYVMTPPEIDLPDDFILSPVAYAGSLIKDAVNVPIIGCFGLNDKEKVEFILENDFADIAGVARGILADYDFPKGVLIDAPYMPCMGCKKCFWYTEDHTNCPARINAAKQMFDFDRPERG